MKTLYGVALVLLTLLTLASLALNVAVILGLLHARDVALEGAASVRDLLGGLKGEVLSYTVEVNEEIPVVVSVPIEQEVRVPLNTSVPINTTITVPIEAGLLGSYDIDVPVRTVIPIDLEVVVPVSQTVSIDTTVPLDVDVPIEIAIADTPLLDHLEAGEAALKKLEEGLMNPPFLGKK